MGPGPRPLGVDSAGLFVESMTILHGTGDVVRDGLGNIDQARINALADANVPPT